MPVKKFRDVSEMETTAYHPGSPELFDALRRVWTFSSKICPLEFPPGVYKHRSIDDAEALRARWQQANAARQQARIRR
jgi:hypothetical protein